MEKTLYFHEILHFYPFYPQCPYDLTCLVDRDFESETS